MTGSQKIVYVILKNEPKINKRTCSKWLGMSRARTVGQIQKVSMAVA